MPVGGEVRTESESGGDNIEMQLPYSGHEI